jgi:hypothetical protein
MAQRDPPSAASQIWPNLARGTPNEVEQRRTPSLADALFPSLSREAKRREAAQARWDALHTLHSLKKKNKE